MPTKPPHRCPGCMTWTTNKSRCTDCAAKVKKQRNAEAKIAAEVAASVDVCPLCGEPPTADNPITADHYPVPLRDGGRLTPNNRRPACRRCNSRREAGN